MRSIRAASCAALVAIVVSAPLRASADPADDKNVCLYASSRAQAARASHKLLDARSFLRACAQSTCPAVIRRDCVTWLDEVEAAVPSIVASLKDGDGNDVLDAAVSMDGAPLVDKLTGTAVTVEPGPHRFRFARPDGTSVEVEALVAEGGKSVPVVGRFPAREVPAPPIVVTPRVVATSPVRIAGWAIAGVGVAGLVAGGVFGGLAIADKSAGGCNASNHCTNFGSITSAKTAATVSDAGLIAGGVLAATGVTMVVLGARSSARAADSAWLEALPSVASGAAGIAVRGGF